MLHQKTVAPKPKAIARGKLNMAELLISLIRFDTSKPANYIKATDYLKLLFEEVGCEVREMDIPKNRTGLKEPRVNLIGHLPGQGSPVILYTHIDVVQAGSWKYAFQPRYKEGKIFGRGSSDMLGAIVALLDALDKIKELPLAHDIWILITTDEETFNQELQLRYLFKYLQKYITPKDALIIDLDCFATHIEIADLARIELELEIKGESAHAAHAGQGINAILDAIKIITALDEKTARILQEESAFPSYPEKEPIPLKGSLKPTIIHSGDQSNKIPDVCQCVLDIRIVPEQDIATVEKNLKETLARLFEEKQVKGRIANMKLTPGFITNAQAPVVKELAKIAKGVTGEQITSYAIAGSCDLPGAVKRAGWHEAMIIGLGVTRKECHPHGDNEFVYLKDMENLSEVLFQFFTGVTRKG